MSQLLGTVISAQVTTGDTANTFSIGDTNLMQGGHHTVVYLEERDGITTERRREGMTCWVAGTVSTLYRLTGGTNNSDWQEVISAASGGASASAAGYFLEDTASGTDAYKTLSPVLSGSAEVVVPVVVSSGSLEPVGSFIGPQINRYGIDAGVWQFINYAKVADAGNPSQVVVEVYTRSLAGAETFLFSGTSGPVNRSSVLGYSIFSSQGSFTAPAPTDKLVAKYYGLRAAVPASVLSFYYSGTVNASLFTTPIGITHNGLKGLQGGQADQYYHASADQHGALAGYGGTPTAANPYVTQAGLDSQGTNLQAQIDQQGTNLQTQIDQQGTNLQTQIIQQGTNFQGQIDQERTERLGADNLEIIVRGTNDTYLQDQLNSIFAILGIGFSGTFSLYMGQFRNGPPDTKITVINGVITGQVESAYVWEDFENYATGTLPTLNRGSSWAGAGTVIANPGYGVQAEDNNESYTSGGTVGVTVVLSGGTGWGANGTVVVPYIAMVGTESFETYATGTVSDPGVLIDGIGFSGAPAIYAY